MRRLPAIVAATFAIVAVTPLSAHADTTSTSVATTSSSTTTTTLKPQRIAPLTGLPDPTASTKRHSALTVKIDNTYLAHPHYGIDQADVVYEEIVEGGITRLAAIFDSHIPIRVGPVRSVRRTDREIVYPIGGLFAFSGGAYYAVQTIKSAPVKLFDQSTSAGAMYRDSTRPPPHNLFLNAPLLIKMQGQIHVPSPLFTYVARSTPAVGAPVGSFVVNFLSGYATSFVWNAATRSWDRSIYGAPDVTATHVRVSPTNVIVMNVNYKGGVGVEGSEAQLTGSGPVEIFTNGRHIKGIWFRAKIGRPTGYRSTSGKVIGLRAGQTWVELLATGMTTSVYPPKK